MSIDPRITAIRNHPKVGLGSCTSIDECYGDEELAKQLDEDGVKTEADALKWALEREGMWIEQGLNCRYGDDDDAQLKLYREWHNEDC
jgi:hypothetical protein